ncbi:MAG: hypothetical protein HZC54_13305 [Verrucomicrobia bacterium]|nr:hypothetical protein [Verrucomicrobiota bacterium]
MNKSVTLKKRLAMLDAEHAAHSIRAAQRAPLPEATACAGAQVVDSYIVVCHSYLELPCEFVLPFGEVCYCGHPRRLEIAARTRELERARRQSAIG